MVNEVSYGPPESLTKITTTTFRQCAFGPFGLFVSAADYFAVNVGDVWCEID